VYAVVIDRVKGDPGEVARTLGEALGRTAYELRASAQPPEGGPVVVSVHAERAPADLQAKRLCERAIDAVVHPVDDPLPDRMTVRSFELTDDTLRVTSRQDKTDVIRFASIELLLRVMQHTESTSTETVRDRKFSLGKALLTGGLAMTRTTKTTRTTATAEAQQLVLVFAGSHPVAFLGERDVTYPPLGAALQASRAANFQHLLTELRHRAPRALYDDRLVRRSALVQTLGPVLGAGNDLDFAAAMIASSLLRGSTPPDGASRVALFSSWRRDGGAFAAGARARPAAWTCAFAGNATRRPPCRDRCRRRRHRRAGTRREAQRRLDDGTVASPSTATRRCPTCPATAPPNLVCVNAPDTSSIGTGGPSVIRVHANGCCLHEIW
jgi:hypothetical protein